MNAGTSRSSCETSAVMLFFRLCMVADSRATLAGDGLEPIPTPRVLGWAVIVRLDWVTVGGAERTVAELGTEGMKAATVRSFSIAAEAAVTVRSVRCDAAVLNPVAITVIFTSSFI